MGKGFKKMLNALIGFILTLALVLISSPTATAAEEPEFNLDDCVITANRVLMKQSETAASVTVITREEIEKGGYTRVLDILESSNISVYNSASAGYCQSAIFINGDDRVLVMVDGRGINKQYVIGGGRTKVDLNLLPSVKNIERIEIVRGPSSSLYGSYAAGGVVNIITRQATDAKTNLQVLNGSWGMRNYTLTTENKEKDFSYLITAERKRQDYFEYRDAKTEQIRQMPNSAIDQDAISMRFEKELKQGRSLTLDWRYVDSNVGYYLGAPGYPWFFPTAYEVDRNHDLDLTYRWKNRAGTDGLLKVYHSVGLLEVNNYMEGTPYAVDKYSITSRATGVDWQDNWKITDNYDLLGGLIDKKLQS